MRTIRFPLFLYFLLATFLGRAQDFYHKDPMTKMADALDIKENHKEALALRIKVLENINQFPLDYQAYVWSKYYHTQANVSEMESYKYHNPKDSISATRRKDQLLKAIQWINKAKAAYQSVTKQDKQHLYNLQNRIYHQNGYLGQWENALKEAKLGYTILKDTLGERNKKMVDLIYDLGYINDQLGRYNEAIDYYQKSLNLYEKIIDSAHTDIAQAYLNMANQYRKLGFKPKELSSLIKAKEIWENIKNSKDDPYLYRCYRALFTWYLEYGDLHTAENYLQKKQQLFERESKNRTSFIRNQEERYHRTLSQSKDKIVLSLKKEDTVAGLREIDSFIASLPNQNQIKYPFEAFYKTWALQEFARLVQNDRPNKALSMIDEAISIAIHTEFHIDVYPFIAEKTKLLLKQKKWKEAISILEKYIPSAEKNGKAETFTLYITYGKILNAIDKTTEAELYFQKAIQEACANKNIVAETITFNDLKPLVSFETIEGFLDMGDFYFNRSGNGQDIEMVKKALQRYFLASKLFHNLYLGRRYNHELYKTYNSLTDRLLKCAIALPKEDTATLAKIANESENNASSLTWSRFIFSQNKMKMGLPELVLQQENNIRSQLDFYYSKLYSSHQERDSTKLNQWNATVDSLKWEQEEVLETIKNRYSGYYNMQSHDFDILSFQNNVKENTTVLKYIFTKEKLYLFKITNRQLSIHELGKRQEIDHQISAFLNALKERQKLPENLSKILVPKSIYPLENRLVIVPDGLLNYIPLEVLFNERTLPSITYTPSLILFRTQMGVAKEVSENKMGAFSSSGITYKMNVLPNSGKEIKNILSIFPGNHYSKATKDIFLEKGSEYDLLHFATHSSIDPDPDLSALVFNGEKLLTKEIYNQHLKAKMVVLSSCETGIGSYEAGEGIMSLARAFTYAGIPSAVFALWQVEDRATAQLMDYYYKNLKKGWAKDKALKMAKLDYLNNTEDPLLRHPYYWAGFVLTGNTDSIYENRNWIWWCLGISVAVLLLLWTWKGIRKFGK